MTADLINGLFEAGGAAFTLLNVARLVKDRCLNGVSWIPTAFFSAWGFWNLYFYPALGQWASFAGGCLIVLTNLVWLALVWYYSIETTIAAHEFVLEEPGLY